VFIKKVRQAKRLKSLLKNLKRAIRKQKKSIKKRRNPRSEKCRNDGIVCK